MPKKGVGFFFLMSPLLYSIEANLFGGSVASTLLWNPIGWFWNPCIRTRVLTCLIVAVMPKLGFIRAQLLGSLIEPHLLGIIRISCCKPLQWQCCYVSLLGPGGLFVVDVELDLAFDHDTKVDVILQGFFFVGGGVWGVCVHIGFWLQSGICFGFYPVNWGHTAKRGYP